MRFFYSVSSALPTFDKFDVMEVLFEYVLRGFDVNSGQASQGMDLQVTAQPTNDGDPSLLLSASK